MGCTQRELQQPCSCKAKVLRQITILTIFFVIIAFRRITQNLFDYSTVNISGPPEFTNIVCSN